MHPPSAPSRSLVPPTRAPAQPCAPARLLATSPLVKSPGALLLAKLIMQPLVQCKVKSRMQLPRASTGVRRPYSAPLASHAPRCTEKPQRHGQASEGQDCAAVVAERPLQRSSNTATKTRLCKTENRELIKPPITRAPFHTTLHHFTQQTSQNSGSGSLHPAAAPALQPPTTLKRFARQRNRPPALRVSRIRATQ